MRGQVRAAQAEDLSELVRQHFRINALSAADVSNPKSAIEAFAQAFTAWVTRRFPSTKILSFNLRLVDRAFAEHEVCEFGWHTDVISPLYLAIELENDNLHVIGEQRANALRRLHPSLLYTAMTGITEASARSLHMRTPDEFLNMLSRWYWDGEILDDKGAREALKERYSEDDEDIQRYLPSVVRPQLAPDDLLPQWMRADKSLRLSVLGPRAVRSLGETAKGWRRDFCYALADLQLALRRMGDASLLHGSQWAEPAYVGASIAYQAGDYVGDLIDAHFQCCNEGGYTDFQCFIPLADTPAAIRKQYALMDQTLSLITLLDRALAELFR
ncbi:hypothetical protein LMG32289_06093 [Cupriavidus pampae]|uniref:PRTRC system protein F n=1 Tax=Cupriavidus pampae TaxID=659251 RepID=A0ABM8XZ78_9BURK|nr:hypothetical protein LMG32289_06093 [Cupriavidus pampae]